MRRVADGRLSEATLVRLDTEAVAFALYVGGQALLGAIVGRGLATLPAVRGRPGRSAALLAAVLGGVQLLALGPVWQHRELPVGFGVSLVGLGALLALTVAWIGGGLLSRLPERVRSTGARALPPVLLLAGVVTLFAAGRSPGTPAGVDVDSPVRVDTGTRVAILALDGLDPLMVEAALAQGRLPNLADLLTRGTRGSLRSLRPPKSPVVWTSVVTGMLPRTHGITDFVVRRGGERIPVTSNRRRVPALWNLAPDAGFSCAFVNWYVTWPAEPTTGVIVSDRVDFDGLGQRVFPEEMTAVIDSVRATLDESEWRDVSRFTNLGEGFDAWRTDQWGQIRRSLQILDDVVRHDLVTLESTRAVIRMAQPDLTALYFRGTDNTQHLFWKYRLVARGDRVGDTLYGDLESANVEALSPVVDRYYDFIDEVVGEVVAMLEADTALLIVSDHGFLTNNERSRWFNVNRLLEAAGLATLLGGTGGEADSANSTVLDPGAPTVAPRRILRAGGRAADAAKALELARDVLTELRTDTGDAVFRSVALGDDNVGPRLSVVFAPRITGDYVRLGDTEVPLSEFHVTEGHSGDHRMNGFLLAVGPPFRPGAVISGARALDIAPTVLHLLGAPVARDMEGVVLIDALTDEWKKGRPIRYVESYGRRDASSDVISTDADERILEELRALGYLR